MGDRLALRELAVSAAALTGALTVAVWAAQQLSTDPGRQALVYLAVPLTGALLAWRRGRPLAELVTIYAEVLLVPLLLAGQLVRLGLPVALLPLLLGLQVTAVAAGRWIRR